MSALRVDAQRNLERVLEAATGAIAELGPAVTMDEIARRAGVGHATVFRRFPTKDALIEAVVAERVSELRELSAAALADPDPGVAFERFVWSIAELHMGSRGLHECIARWKEAEGAPQLDRDVLRIVRRAQEAGAVRGDVAPEEVMGLMRAALHSSDDACWRRLLQVVLDGLRPPAGRRG